MPLAESARCDEIPQSAELKARKRELPSTCDGGGYYIDVGASKLIADGKIKIKQGQEVDRLTEKGIKFADGVELEADIIVSSAKASVL